MLENFKVISTWRPKTDYFLGHVGNHCHDVRLDSRFVGLSDRRSSDCLQNPYTGELYGSSSPSPSDYGDVYKMVALRALTLPGPRS